MNESVRIIGAGLTGALMAVCLARRGIPCEIFERRADLRLNPLAGGRSINLALANRGLAALAHAGLEDAVRALLIPMRGRMLHAADGELSFQPYGQREHEVIYSVSRNQLNAVLLTAADAHPHAALHFEHRVEDLQFEDAILSVRDKRTDQLRRLRGGPVICAGGASSRIRRRMMRRPGYRADVDHLRYGYRELTIPPGPNGAHRMEAEALHIWPRGSLMMIALPNLDGSFTVTLFLPRHGPDSFETLDHPGARRRFFEAHFPDSLDLIPELDQAFEANPVGSMQTVWAWPWHVGGQALLLGDAAHGIVPFHGQGMNAAFEDCRLLDLALGDGEPRWGSVFASFAAARKADTDAIAEMALENHIEMRDAVRDEGFQLRRALAFELERRLPRHFVPRYSMVSFHQVPYAIAQARGRVQRDLLAQFTAGCRSLSEVDLAGAEAAVRANLTPLAP